MRKIYLFHIKYFRNPLERAWPKKSAKGNDLVNRGMRNLKRKLVDSHRNLNNDRNGKRVIHGMSYIYGFKYRSFMNDNFRQGPKHLTFHGGVCTLAKWIKITYYLHESLETIRRYKNLSSLLHSAHAKYIQITNIKDIYHPRKKHFVSNARTKLAKIGRNERHDFIGTFQRFGSKTNGQLTVLLTNITYHHEVVTDHLWFNATKEFRSLGHLDAGEHLGFKARVKRYRKGYLPDSFIKKYDYELCYPTQIKRLD